jgi:hypothetical protein
MFGNYQNPYDKAMPIFNKIPGELHGALDPYINRGNAAGNMLGGEYGNLLANPGGKLNQIGAGYHESPGLQFAIKMALQKAGNAAAAGGMAGSPQHEYQNMDIATNLANQDYNNWIRNAIGLYGTGISGEQGFYDTGAKAGIGLGEDIASVLANQANLEAERQNVENQHEGGMWGGFGSLAGGLLKAFL